MIKLLRVVIGKAVSILFTASSMTIMVRVLTSERSRACVFVVLVRVV